MLLLPSLYLKFYMILTVQLCHKKMRNPVRYEDILRSTLFFIDTLRPIHSFFADISDLSLYLKSAEDTLEPKQYVVIYCGLSIKRSWLLTSPPCVQIFVCMQFLIILSSATISLDSTAKPPLQKNI